MPNSDTNQYFWNIFNFKNNILQFKNPFITEYIFYPFGTSLIMHTYTPLLSIFALLFGNSYMALNIFLMLNFIFSALGVYILCRLYKSNFWLALFAGIVYGFCPYKMIRLTEHYHLLLTAFVPFFVLFCIKAFYFNNNKFLPKIISKANLIKAVICGVFVCLSDYYSAFSLIYFCIFYALYKRYFSKFNYRSPYFWVWAALFITISHIILHQFKVFAIDNKGGIWWSGDLLSFFIPPQNSSYLNFDFFRKIENSIYHYPQSVEYCMFSGFTFLIILMWAIKYLIKSKINEDFKPFLFAAFMFLLMIVPDLKIAGKSILNTPMSFFHYIPFLNNLRSPTRMYPMFLLVVLPAFCFILSLKFEKFRYKNLLFILLLAITVFEYKPKEYDLVNKNQVPKMIKFLASQPQGALLNIPFGIRDGFIEKGSFNTKKLYYQTIHQKPMADGYISRLDKKIELKYDNEFYKNILLLQSGKKVKESKLKLPVDFRYILIEKPYIKDFEPYFDKIVKCRKFKSNEYLLLRIY